MIDPLSDMVDNVQKLFCLKYHYCDDCPAKIQDIWGCGFEKIQENLENEK